MSLRRLLLIAPLALTLAACDDDECEVAGCPTPPLGGRLYVVNAARSLGDVQLLVDGGVERIRIEPGTSSGTVFKEPGAHAVRLFRIGEASNDVEIGVTLNDNIPRLLVVHDQAGAVSTLQLPDTAAIVPAGATKLRVVHAAAGAPAVDVWRTQPDFATATRVMTPFAYLASSSYLQSTPGTWTVTVTPSSGGATPPATTLATATVTLAAGERASIVLVPGTTAGSIALVTVKEF